MIHYHSHRYLYWVSACLVFLFFALAFTASGESMFGDSDPLMHLAIGDLLRERGGIPRNDVFSFASGNYEWVHISWVWGYVISLANAYSGWHGSIAINAIIIALTFSIVFLHSLERSRDNLVAVLVAMLCMILVTGVILRPLQVTNLLVAIWMLILGIVARDYRQKKWLFVLPVTMLLWVNVHGGFIIAPVLLGAFFLQAWNQKQFALMKTLFIIGLLVGVAGLCNPHGIYMISAIWRTLTGSALTFINEWQPAKLSFGALLNYALAVIFILLVPRNRTLTILSCERWLAYFWLLMAVTSIRNFPIFAVIATPIVACALQQYFTPKNSKSNQQAEKIIAGIFAFANRRSTAYSLLVTCLFVAIWLPTNAAKNIYGNHEIKFLTLKSEIAFIEKNHPNARLLTDFNMAGYLLYETRGKIKTFIDPRTDSAIPPDVINAYTNFTTSKQGWEDMFERYDIDGVMLANPEKTGNSSMIDRFKNRTDWKRVYEGPLATIFVRVKQKE